jgi:cytochrome c
MTMSRLFTPAAALLAAATMAIGFAALLLLPVTGQGRGFVQDQVPAVPRVGAGQKGTMAPNLLGVVGRKAGATDFAMYSPQLKAFGKAWTPALIDQWIAGPTKLVPGSRMAMVVPDAADACQHRGLSGYAEEVSLFQVLKLGRVALAARPNFVCGPLWHDDGRC